MASTWKALPGPVVLQSLHTYLKPVVHPATVVVELYAGKLGTSSLVLEHRLSTLEDPQGTYGEGHCKLVAPRGKPFDARAGQHTRRDRLTQAPG